MPGRLFCVFWGAEVPRSCDRSYHEWRAREEAERADNAKDPSIAMIHRELAALHRRRMMEAVDNSNPAMPQAKTRTAGPGH